jgi:hypothetical protein
MKRIVKPNLDSQDPQRVVAAVTKEDPVADLVADLGVEWVPALAVVVAKSTFPTFVSNLLIFLYQLV